MKIMRGQVVNGDKMEWNLIVLAMGLIGVSIGLTIGMVLPRNLMIDYFFNLFYLLMIFVMLTVGIISLSFGLRK